MELPSNSQASRVKKVTEATEESETTVENENVTQFTGSVKKTLGSRFKNVFTSGGETFTEHLIKEVVIPGLQELVVTSAQKALDGVAQAIEQAITGQTTSRYHRSRTSGRTGNVPYHRMSTPSRQTSGSVIRMPPRRSNRVEDIIVSSLDDANEIINYMDTLVSKYNHCAVGDLYEFLQKDVCSTDYEWGWTNLSNLMPRRVGTSGDFRIRFPPTEVITDGR